MTIEEFLEHWKTESLFGERQFKKLNGSLVAGESLYILSQKANVSVNGVNKTIEINKFFQTNVQELTKNDETNTNGDIYVCQHILNQLEADFFKDYNDFIDSEVKKITN